MSDLTQDFEGFDEDAAPTFEAFSVRHPDHDPARSLGYLAVAWMEHMPVHGFGDAMGEAVRLDQATYDLIVDAYALSPAGKRLYTQVCYVLPKGVGKTLARRARPSERNPHEPLRQHRRPHPHLRPPRRRRRRQLARHPRCCPVGGYGATARIGAHRRRRGRVLGALVTRASKRWPGIGWLLGNPKQPTYAPAGATVTVEVTPSRTHDRYHEAAGIE